MPSSGSKYALIAAVAAARSPFGTFGTGSWTGAGVGSTLPALSTVTLAAVVAVSCDIPNCSLDVPVTRTESPTATAVGQELQKTKMPSDVAGSTSAWVSSS